MLSFPSKVGWTRLRKRENKKLSFCFVLTRTVKENSKKIAKKNQKIIKYSYGFFWSQNRVEKNENERKWKLSFRFVPTPCVIQNSKKIEENFNKLKNTIMALFQQQ